MKLKNGNKSFGHNKSVECGKFNIFSLILFCGKVIMIWTKLELDWEDYLIDLLIDILIFENRKKILDWIEL